MTLVVKELPSNEWRISCRPSSPRPHQPSFLTTPEEPTARAERCALHVIDEDGYVESHELALTVSGRGRRLTLGGLANECCRVGRRALRDRLGTSGEQGEGTDNPHAAHLFDGSACDVPQWWSNQTYPIKLEPLGKN